MPTPAEIGISISSLRRLLKCSPETGKLYWNSRPAEMFTSTRAMNSFNARRASKPALDCLDCSGYFVGNIGRHRFLAHRVVWALAVGKWPEDELDHINCDPTDNRIANLRPADRFQNMQNRKAFSVGVDGLKGISREPNGKKWRAQIRSNGRYHYLGLFNSAEAAHAAYVEAAVRLNGQFARAA